MNKLAEYEFEVQYKPGKQNTIADTLSRLCESGQEPMVSEVAKDGLPDGLNLLKSVPGGGDSLVVSLWVVLAHHRDNHALGLFLPAVSNELRKELADELLKDPKKYGLGNQ